MSIVDLEAVSDLVKFSLGILLKHPNKYPRYLSVSSS